MDIRFTVRPDREGWESFCALSGVQTPILGIEEKNVEGDVPEQATFYYPVDEEERPSLEEIEAVLAGLNEQLFQEGTCSIEWRTIPEEDWGRNWRRHFHLMRIGDRIFVGPPWETDLPGSAPANAVHVTIDPGQAFGTGSHESTQLCLRLLELKSEAHRCLLDVGTGSGILSFAAIKLGMQHAIGTEYDPVCEENFYLNADLNGVREHVRFVLTPAPAEGVEKARAAGSPAPDLIVCNMLSERFRPLLPGMRTLRLPVLLSGFLVSEMPSVTAEAEAAGFKIAERFQLEEWAAFLLA